ncbi:MAG: histidine phosphotransferase family protein [Pseudomonadota bacterium]
MSLSPQQHLAQAVASRICHDLVSPVGAVVNGMDLLGEMAGMPATEEITLIGQSARRSADVLAFHRLALGAGTEAGGMARPKVLAIVEAMLAGPRIPLSRQGAEGPPIGRMLARTVALSALCLRQLLGMRGALSIRLAPETDYPVAVRVDGVDLERRAAMVALLLTEQKPGPGCDPRTVEFLLVRDAARQAGALFEPVVSGTTAEITLRPF